MKHDAVCASGLKLLCHTSSFWVKSCKFAKTNQQSPGNTAKGILQKITFLVLIDVKLDVIPLDRSWSHRVMCCPSETDWRSVWELNNNLNNNVSLVDRSLWFSCQAKTMFTNAQHAIFLGQTDTQTPSQEHDCDYASLVHFIADKEWELKSRFL